MTPYKDFAQVDPGPLAPLLDDPEVTEIMVNGLTGVYVEKKGQITQTDVQFESEDQILALIHQILDAIGRSVDEYTPVVDARLPDNSRVNVVLRPIALDGPLLTIRKFHKHRMTWDDLIGYGSLNEKMKMFLEACVKARRNMVMAGGTSSGKTTVLNAISEFIPHHERIVTAEVTAELDLVHPHVVKMEARPPDSDGRGEVTVESLIQNACWMRPDRILSGEVQDRGAWEMLRVMTAGHDGSMFTMHAISVADVLERLEMMATISSNLPLLFIRSRIAQAIDVSMLQLQLADGTRKLMHITEVVGLKNNVIETQDIFRYEVAEDSPDGVIGQFRTTGYRPTFARFLDLPPGFFDA